MPPYVRKPTMLGDPSVVAGWRFLSAESSTGTGPQTLGAPHQHQQQPPQPPPAQQRNDVETFLRAAEGQLWRDADVDEDALVDRVEALLAGPEEAEAEAELQLPQISSRRGTGLSAEQRAEGGEGSGGVNFDEYVYSTAANAGTVRESLGGGGTVAAAPSGLSAPLSMESVADPGADGATPAASDRPASRPVEEQPGAVTGAEFGVNRGMGHGATAGMGRVGRAPRGARTGQVVPLPSVAVDSSFTYTPRQARARPARYGAWYLPIKSWQKGGAPKPPPQLTKEQKEKIEETSQKRATMAAAVKTAACPIAFKEYLRHQRACEALEVLEQARSALGEGQLEEIAAIKAEFTNYKLSSREVQKRIRELLAGGPIHRQQLGLQFAAMCKDDSDFPDFLRGTS